MSARRGQGELSLAIKEIEDALGDFSLIPDDQEKDKLVDLLKKSTEARNDFAQRFINIDENNPDHKIDGVRPSRSF